MLTLLAAACGGGEAPVAPVGGGDGDGNTEDAGTEDTSTGPLVKITSPVAAKTPSDPAVIVGSTLSVTCNVKQRPGYPAVDTASVTMTAYSGSDTMGISTSAPLKADPSGNGNYTGSFALGDLRGGTIRIRCTASDVSPTNPNEGHNEISTLYDSGPIIDFPALKDGDIVALGNDPSPDTTITFSVKPLKLGDSDPDANIAAVTLKINDVAVSAAYDKASGTYNYPLDFQTLFKGSPADAVPIAVSATDKRKPMAGVSNKQLKLNIDGEGPEIKITAPLAKNGTEVIVGAQTDVQMTITDALAGVATGADKLYATIGDTGGTGMTYPIESLPANVYQFTFFAAQFENTSDVTANIHAEDNAGNVSTLAYTMRFDTVPPYISLDPGPVRTVSALKNGICSAAFDPLGNNVPSDTPSPADANNAPSDGSVILQASLFRAEIWERGTEIPGATHIWYSLADETSAKVVISEADAPPLLIDKVKDANNYCDTISGGSEIKLTQLKAGGTSPGVKDTNQGDAPEDSVPTTLCTNATKPFKATVTGLKGQCDDADPYYVIKQTMGSTSVSAVYATQPTSGGTGCTGTSVDVHAKSGWICVVATVVDNAGNVGLSKPLRLCRALSDGDCNGATVGQSLEPPADLTCTDGCKLPPIMEDFSVDKVILE